MKFKVFIILSVISTSCSKPELPEFYQSLLGKWHPIFENIDSLHPAHYPPTFTFKPYQQAYVDSIYDYFKDGVGIRIKYTSCRVLWSVSDSLVIFHRGSSCSDLFSMFGYSCYNSFMLMEPYLKIIDINENEIWFMFTYHNRTCCASDLSHLEQTRIWKYYKE